ncbi:hypothetical protein PVK06_037645 [Gossypium arboreum]|uniref:Uncharacterized protein n=1 Tax=Gossypium arboreum TaxID=29729 RepID=A0ABR0MYD2_GOSAR|nr:hypothetical protein PVK06_037645 [Gossypium arboreum]
MSESKSCLVKSQKSTSKLDSDMAAAAEQLIQLSDEDNNNSSSCTTTTTKTKMIQGKRSCEDITCAKIEEIFGKEDEILRPVHKKQKYKSLDRIYKETKPIKVSYGNNLWY